MSAIFRFVPHSACQSVDLNVTDIGYIALKFSTTCSEQQTLVQTSSPLLSAAKTIIAIAFNPDEIGVDAG